MRNFEVDEDASRSRIRCVATHVRGSLNPIPTFIRRIVGLEHEGAVTSKTLEDAFANAWRKLDNGEEVVCVKTGAAFPSGPKPNALIFDVCPRRCIGRMCHTKLSHPVLCASITSGREGDQRGRRKGVPVVPWSSFSVLPSVWPGEPGREGEYTREGGGRGAPYGQRACGHSARGRWNLWAKLLSDYLYIVWCRCSMCVGTSSVLQACLLCTTTSINLKT